MKLRVPGTQALAEPQDDSDFRAAGDRARNRGDWAEAVTNYKAHLARKPGDFEIWVQLGHALKESGRLSAALVAYGEALGLNENDADLLLNMGHLHKVMGLPEDAISYYRRSAERDGNADAISELLHLGAASSPG